MSGLTHNRSLVPYYPISEFYRNRFGGKVQKISVSLADDCPNRRGLKGMKVCSFCDEWGSAAYPEFRKDEVTEQIRRVQEQKSTANPSARYLIYFQAYTNTFLKLSKLEAAFETVLSLPRVVGVVVGTRPDCLSQGVLQLWQRFHEQAFVSVELGVQSFEDRHLEFYRRGHSAQDSIDAIRRIRNETSVDLGIHLMFGNPQETPSEIVRAARACNELGVQNVKLHNLHVLKGTPLADLYHAGQFQPVSLEQYSERVGLFLAHLNPNIPVHRLTATSSRWEELIAPDWTRYHLKGYQFIIEDMQRLGLRQGLLLEPPARTFESWARP